VTEIDINGGFENGWTHGLLTNAGYWRYYRGRKADEPPGVQEIKVPTNWRIRVATDAVPNPYYDGNPVNQFQQPELDMKERLDIPVDEWDLYFDGPDSQWCAKPFGAYRAWMAATSRPSKRQPARSRSPCHCLPICT